VKDTGSARGGIQHGFCLILFLSIVFFSAPLVKDENSRLVINHSSINFGSVQVGGRAWRRLILTNSGSSRITIIQ
jgi:hypothetical protein